MTDKEKLDKIVAEIERLIGDYNIKTEKYRGRNEQAHQYYGGKRDALSEMLNSIVSMQEEANRSVWHDASKEEPVSEDLEKAAINYMKSQNPPIWGLHDGFIAGAKWREEQFEKNRLEHCNSITNEQAELEQKFLDEHLDKYNRMPTFLDAIEYGMRLQKEQMMAKAVDAGCFGFQGAALFSFRLPSDKYLIGSKVKVIVIKED